MDFGISNENKSLFNDIFSIIDDLTGTEFNPSWEFKSLEDSVVVDIDLPSVDKASVDVEVRDGVLTVSGERVKGEDIMHTNRRYGKFTKSFKLGEELDIDSVEASFVDGVLSVTIKKKAVAKASKIEIK